MWLRLVPYGRNICGFVAPLAELKYLEVCGFVTNNNILESDIFPVIRSCTNLQIVAVESFKNLNALDDFIDFISLKRTSKKIGSHRS